MTEKNHMILKDDSAGSLGNMTTGIYPLGPKIKTFTNEELIKKIESLGAEYHFLIHEWPERDYFIVEIMRKKR